MESRTGSPINCRLNQHNRSFRDLLDMITSDRAQEIEELKAGSVSKTHVFPTQIEFSFVWMRFIVAALLIVLGLALHVALRRFAFYARA